MIGLGVHCELKITKIRNSP